MVGVILCLACRFRQIATLPSLLASLESVGRAVTLNPEIFKKKHEMHYAP
jgi:hypothetical protein